MIGWHISKFFAQLFGVLYPAYMSYNAIKTPMKDDDTQWLTYWTVFSLFSTLEFLLDFIIHWIPLYYEMKLLFVIWMALPYTNGALFIWQKLEPILDKHIVKLEQQFAKLRAKKTVTSPAAPVAPVPNSFDNRKDD